MSRITGTTRLPRGVPSGVPGDVPSEERGDVPGWVLISLMTAGLVVLIWGLAGTALAEVFDQAIQRVINF